MIVDRVELGIGGDGPPSLHAQGATRALAVRVAVGSPDAMRHSGRDDLMANPTREPDEPDGRLVG